MSKKIHQNVGEIDIFKDSACVEDSEEEHLQDKHYSSPYNFIVNIKNINGKNPKKFP
jgi:hypothetical protein